VKNAVRNNALNNIVYDRYLKLMREQENFEKSKEEKSAKTKGLEKLPVRLSLIGINISISRDVFPI